MPRKKNKSTKNLLFWLSAGVIIILLWNFLQTPASANKEVSFSQFMNDVEANKVEDVTITGTQVRGKYRDGETFKTTTPGQYNDLVGILRQHQVSIDVKEANRSPWLSLVLSWFPFVLLIVFWVLMMRQMQAGGNKGLSFGARGGQRAAR